LTSPGGPPILGGIKKAFRPNERDLGNSLFQTPSYQVFRQDRSAVFSALELIVAFAVFLCLSKHGLDKVFQKRGYEKVSELWGNLAAKAGEVLGQEG
jgi:hypothetical protein